MYTYASIYINTNAHVYMQVFGGTQTPCQLSKNPES